MEANAGEYIKKYLHLKRFPRISLHCKLVPVQYREYEYGLLRSYFLTDCHAHLNIFLRQMHLSLFIYYFFCLLIFFFNHVCNLEPYLTSLRLQRFAIYRNECNYVFVHFMEVL